MARSRRSLSSSSAELERDLVRFAQSPRFERSLVPAMLEAADSDGELDEAELIGVIDRFALQHRVPDGKTVLDRFVASRPDLTAADRETLLGWRDPGEGIFEIRSKDRDAIVLLNLLDDLEYCTYSSVGRAAFPALPGGGFVCARLVPIGPVPGAWLVDPVQVARCLRVSTKSVYQCRPALAGRRPGCAGVHGPGRVGGRLDERQLAPATRGTGPGPGRLRVHRGR